MIPFGITAKVKLAATAVLLTVVAVVGLYVHSLRSENKGLIKDKAVLEETVKTKTATIEEMVRREKALKEITVKFDDIRLENRTVLEQKIEKVRKNVEEGKDTPVGPILSDYFDSLQHNKTR